MVHLAAVRAVEVVVAQVLRFHLIQRGMNVLTAHPKGFMTMLATDLHLGAPSRKGSLVGLIYSGPRNGQA